MNLNSIRERYIFYTIPFILFCFLPFFLITGPFLSDLAVSIIALSYLAYCFKKKTSQNLKINIFIFFYYFGFI